jgi:hypothetical protein
MGLGKDNKRQYLGLQTVLKDSISDCSVAVPVLPEVGSTSTVLPGEIKPYCVSVCVCVC